MSKWNLFIDDERNPPNDQEWMIARSSQEVEELLLRFQCMPTHISFDHDLGSESFDGYVIVKRLCDDDISGHFLFPEDFTYNIHSQNLVGAENIRCYLNNYLRWRKESNAKVNQNDAQ